MATISSTGGSTITVDSHTDADMESCCSDVTFELTDLGCEDDVSCFSYDTEEDDEDSIIIDDEEQIVEDGTEERVAASLLDNEVLSSVTNDDDEINRDINALPYILQQLRSNQETFRDLNLVHCDVVVDTPKSLASDQDMILELITAIRSNHSVTKCSVGPDIFLPLRGDQKCMIAEAICRMPSLKCLCLDYTIASDFLQALHHSRFHKHHQCLQHTGIYHNFLNHSIVHVELDQVPGTIEEGTLGNMFMMTLSNFAALTNMGISFTEEFVHPQEELMKVAMWGLSHSRCLATVKFAYKATLPGELDFVLEICASRKADSLKVLKVGCCGEYLTCESYTVVAEMLRAHHQNLNGLVLEASIDDCGAMAIADTLGHSVQDVKALCLGTFDCQDKARRNGLVTTLSRVLGVNRPQLGTQSQSNSAYSSLEYLSLVCQDLDDQGLCDIVAPISQSSLKELVLFLDNENDSAITSRGVGALANMLHVNETIGDLSLICNVLDDDGIIAWATALCRSKATLKHLKLHCSKTIKVTSKGLQALVDMLQENTVLESLEVGCIRGLFAEGDDENQPHPTPVLLSPDEFYRSKIDYYLRLNKAGARKMHLNVNVTPDHFLETVVSQGQDLDTVFYMLTQNPSFVDYGAPMQR